MSASPVLLWGSPRDIPLAAVCTALSRIGTPMFFVDQTRVHETELAFEAASAAGWLRIGDQRCDLAGVRSAYIRPEASTPEGSEVDDAIASWLELTPAPVANRLSAMASNGSKPYQSALIREAGFAVPQTLLTTDAAALRDFHAQHGTIVYKSASGIRSIVSRLDSIDDARLVHLATCPTQFQQYIPGSDYRVHVIGDEVHGHRIDSTADDYRYAGQDGASLQPWPVPEALAERLRALSASLGLAMAGIDLRRQPDGDWVCFEVNPSPGFSFFDEDDDQPLALAVARLLTNPRDGPWA